MKLRTFNSINNYHVIETSIQGIKGYFSLKKYDSDEPKSFMLLMAEVLQYFNEEGIFKIIYFNDSKKELLEYQDFNAFQKHVMNVLGIQEFI